MIPSTPASLSDKPQPIQLGIPIQTLPAVLTINDMVSLSRSSRATIYAAVADGKLKTFKRGRRRFCMASDFLSWLSA